MIRHDEEGALAEAECREVRENRNTSRAGLRGNVVDRNDERVRMERAGS
jgi:hypothetical protein